jgi:hypothetical protein
MGERVGISERERLVECVVEKVPEKDRYGNCALMVWLLENRDASEQKLRPAEQHGRGK